jgi:hypothetical protein
LPSAHYFVCEFSFGFAKPNSGIEILSDAGSCCSLSRRQSAISVT